MSMEMDELLIRKGQGAPMVSTIKTVLIVEPLPDQQWKLARMFTVGGFRVIGTSSVQAAQVLLHSCPVDMILLSPEACVQGPCEAAKQLLGEAPAARLLVMESGHAPGDVFDDEPLPHSEVREAVQDSAVQFERHGVEFVPRPARAADVSALALM